MHFTEAVLPLVVGVIPDFDFNYGVNGDVCRHMGGVPQKPSQGLASDIVID
jgi:hypothetical protein